LQITKEKLLSEEKSKKDLVVSHVVVLAEEVMKLQRELAELEKESNTYSKLIGNIKLKLEELVL
jgi:seryl-tRNA synthetase